jgi:hypothetical protein
MPCTICDNTGWVCENHPDRPWGGGTRLDVCGCGAGNPIPLALFFSHYVECAGCRLAFLVELIRA